MISDYLWELEQSLLYDDEGEDVEADEKKREEEENGGRSESVEEMK